MNTNSSIDRNMHEKAFESLYRDAEFLFEQQRIDSSIVLALMAIEQAGKLYLEVWNKPGKRNHLAKQRATVSLVAAELYLQGIERAGFEVKHRSELSDRQREHLCQREKSPEQTKEFEENILSHMAQEFEEFEHSSALHSLRLGDVFLIRNDILYGEDNSHTDSDQRREIATALVAICKKMESKFSERCAPSIPNS
ncbi:MAG: hypothetical protein GXP06_09295 [Alphaproteobacteria bacterium]|nr:hypothetical protein [Alphaproteobacteria bacterium]